MESSWFVSKQYILIAPVSKPMYRYCPVESNCTIAGAPWTTDAFKLQIRSLRRFSIQAKRIQKENIIPRECSEYGDTLILHEESSEIHGLTQRYCLN